MSLFGSGVGSMEGVVRAWDREFVTGGRSDTYQRHFIGYILTIPFMQYIPHFWNFRKIPLIWLLSGLNF